MPSSIQRSFTAGEIAPALRVRADLNKYRAGLALCQNFYVRPQGGIYSRPGFEYLGSQSQTDAVARLARFAFNAEQQYVLVIEPLTIQIIRDGEFLTSDGSRITVTTPYTADQLDSLQFAQSADQMTIVSLDHAPANFSRYAEDDWRLEDISFAPTTDSPDFPASTLTIGITGITNANPAVVTYTGSDPDNGNSFYFSGIGGMSGINDNTFSVANVDTVANTFELPDFDSTSQGTYTSGGTGVRKSIKTVGSGFGTYSKKYAYVVTAVSSDGVESLPSDEISITSSSLATTAGVRLTWSAVDDTEYYRVYKDPSVGSSLYGWIGDSKNTSFDDYNISPVTSDAPPSDRQPFSESDDDNPSVVGFYQQRQLFSNTYNEPQTVFATQTANYKSLRTSSPAGDDDAVTFTLAAGQINEIRHFVPLTSLILLTSGGVWKITEGSDGVLTPSSVGVRQQSTKGASAVPPVTINATVLYLESNGTRIRDLGYDYSSDTYTGNDLSIMAEHLFNGHQITGMAFADEPDGLLWCVRDDGVLLCLTYQREHQVWGWSQHETNGAVESITVVTEDTKDVLYISVKRVINGETCRFVERLHERVSDNVYDVFCVDSGVTYSGASTSTVTGLDHLEGEEVVVLADGNEIKGLSVSGGSVTLPGSIEAETIHVGLQFIPAFETLPIDFAEETNPLRGGIYSIPKVRLQMQDSVGGWLASVNEDGEVVGDYYEMKMRSDEMSYLAVPLQTKGFEQAMDANPGFSGAIRFEQRSPLPCAILAVIPDISVASEQ